MHDGNGFTMQGQHLIRAVYLLVGLWRSFRKYPIIVHFHRARRGRRTGRRRCSSFAHQLWHVAKWSRDMRGIDERGFHDMDAVSR